MLLKIAPILPALNIQETSLFFRTKLHFNTRDYGNYLVVKKDLVELHYFLWDEKNAFIPSSCCLFDDNVEDLYAKLSSLEILKPKADIKKNIWGKHEFQVMDNNGNLLKFSGI